jgi:hypothetical protein
MKEPLEAFLEELNAIINKKNTFYWTIVPFYFIFSDSLAI